MAFIRRSSSFVFNPFKRLAIDYRDVLIDTGKKSLQHPVKALFYTSNISLLIYAYRTMPSFGSYKEQLVDIRQQEILTSSLIRNRQVEIYVDTIEQLFASKQIHFVDCYLFSLIVYRRRYEMTDHSSKFYENLCSYLHFKRYARIIDIGMFNRWYRLNQLVPQLDVFDETK